MPAQTNSDRILLLESAATVLALVQKQHEKELAEIDSRLNLRDVAFVELCKSHALLQQRHDDYVRRAEVWGQRWWALVPLLVGAVLSLCSALIVALARK